jgi:polygalacturonase
MAGIVVWTMIGDAASVDAVKAGADPTGRTLSTAALQRAIDEVASAGGEVRVPKGEYKITALRLKSGVTLRLDAGAVLRPSRESADYGEEKLPTVGAEGATNIAVVGQGEIEGGGDCFYDANGVALKVRRPHYVLNFIRCQGLKIEGVTLRHSMHWTCRLDCCENLTVRNVTIRNRAYAAQHCTDGIDLVSCRHALIEKCDIETGDDGICLKSDLRHTPADQHPVMSDITVRDCVVASTCNATKIGTETVGDIENVLFERITVRKHPDTAGKNPIPSGVCIAAISLQSNDGAKVRNITCRDYTIEDCYAPVFIQLQHRTSHRRCSLGSLGDITIERIVCKRSLAASQINVCQDGRIGAVTLADFDVRTQEHVEKKPGSPRRPTGRYPEAKSNGVMPAFGLFARDVDGLALRGKMVFTDEGGSGRDKFVFEGVRLTPTD